MSCSLSPPLSTLLWLELFHDSDQLYHCLEFHMGREILPLPWCLLNPTLGLTQNRHHLAPSLMTSAHCWLSPGNLRSAAVSGHKARTLCIQSTVPQSSSVLIAVSGVSSAGLYPLREERPYSTTLAQQEPSNNPVRNHQCHMHATAEGTKGQRGPVLCHEAEPGFMSS